MVVQAFMTDAVDSWRTSPTHAGRPSHQTGCPGQSTNQSPSWSTY